MRLPAKKALITALLVTSGCIMMSPEPGAPDYGGGGDTITNVQPESGLSLKEIASGLTSPIALVDPDDGTNRLFVVDQVGPIRILQDGDLLPAPFLDLTDVIVPIDTSYDERGVLGLAVHPDFETNGRFFVYYSAPLRATGPDDFDHTNVLAEYTVGVDGMGDPASAKILLEIDHPYLNHNGGTLMFGPDGLLYLSVGDGGNKNDYGVGHPPIGNGQDRSSLLGKVLRFDVDDPMGELAIPDDNPFAAMGSDPGGGAEAIYAYGFRNPYRFSFDRLTGDLWLADVGQDLMEEIDFVHAGGDYGWNIKEGFLCFNPMDELAPLPTCPNVGSQGERLIDPVAAYLHPPERGEGVDPASLPEAKGFPQLGLGAIGGFVYRGDQLSKLAGRYLMGDLASSMAIPSGKLIEVGRRGNAWMLEPVRLDRVPGRDPNESTGGSRVMYQRETIPWYVLGLGEDRDGELYVLVNKTLSPMGSTGRVFQLVRTDSLE